ncbi:MAG: PKD domain-containing protein [Bacteroidia bacterium]
MYQPFVLTCLFLGLLIQPSLAHNEPAPTQTKSSHQIRFIENKGQWEAKTNYRLRFKNGDLWFENQQLNYVFYEALSHEHQAENVSTSETVKGHLYQVAFVNANPSPHIAPNKRYEDYYNYYMGNNPIYWKSGVSSFQEIEYQELYQGINAKFYENEGKLKYDFIVQAQANPQQILLEYKGAEKVSLSESGDLHIQTSVNEVRELKPYAYQINAEGKQTQIACKYHLVENQLSFDFPNGYDTQRVLYIDPTVIFSTYTGSQQDNWGFTATYDLQGNAYGGGIVFQGGQPGTFGYPVTAGAFQTVYQGGPRDASIIKYNANGTAPVFSTYFGGAGADQPHSMVTDNNSNLFVFGRTNSANFPVTTGAYDVIQNGGYDIYVAKFDATGTLLACTFVGGSGDDANNVAASLAHNYADDGRGEIVLDANGDCYVAACTRSTNFPTSAGAPQTGLIGNQDGVVFKLNTSLSALVWSSYLGGSEDDAAYSLKPASNNEVFVCGGTSSGDFPATAGVLGQFYYGGPADGFVTRFNNTGTSILRSTFVGTSDYDQAYLLQLDMAGTGVYITGQNLGNFPTINAGYSVPNTHQFIAKMDVDFTAYNFAMTYGVQNTSTINISPTAFLVDDCENIYVSGWGGNVNSGAGGGTQGLDITFDGFQQTTDNSDFYIMVLAPNAAGLTYSTFFGGNGSAEHVDGGTSRFDPKGTIYHAVCAGCGANSLFPTTPGVWSNTNNSANCNLAVFKIDFPFSQIDAIFTPIDTLSGANIITGCVPLTLQFNNGTPSFVGMLNEWDFDDGTPIDTTYSPVHTFVNIGTYQVQLVVSDPNGCRIPDTVTQTIIVKPGPPAPFTATSPVCQGGNSTIQFTGTVSPTAIYNWTFDNGVIASGNPQGPGPLQVYWTTQGIKTLSLFVSDSGCVGDPTFVNVTVTDSIYSDFAYPDTTCINQPEQLVYTGNASPLATYNWNFGPNGVVTSGNGQGPIQIFWSQSGPQTVCLDVNQIGCVTPPKICHDVQVLSPPFPIIAPVADQCLTGNNFTFVYLGDTTVDAIYWHFGSGAFPQQAFNQDTVFNVSYNNAGPKTVSLFLVKDGCISDTAFIVFDVWEEPTADFIVSSQAACLGGCVTLQYTGTVLSNQQTYEWSFGPTANPMYSTLPNPGCVTFNSIGYHTINLIVTHLGCSDTISKQIYVNAIPQVTAGLDGSFCEGQGPFPMSATTLGGTPAYSYSWWSDNPTTASISNPFIEDPTVNPSICTNYYFQVQDTVGCLSNIDSVEICTRPVPKADAGANVSFCDDPGSNCVFLSGGLASTNLAPPPFTYQWLPNIGMAPGQDTLLTPCVHPDSTTIYVLVISSSNGCISSSTGLDTLSTVVATALPIPHTEAGPHQNICFGQATNLQGAASGAGSSYTYTWSPGTTLAGFVNPANIYNPNAPILPQFSHLYTLTSQAANGCTSTDTVSVTVLPLPTAIIDPPVADICQGDSIKLSAVVNGGSTAVGYTYSWYQSAGLSSTSDSFVMASPDTTTTYHVFVNNSGCQSPVDSMTLTINPTPIANILQNDTVLCNGAVMPLLVNYSFNGTLPSFPITYSWFPSGNLTGTNIPNPIASADTNITYYAQVSIGGACPTLDSIYLQVIPGLNATATSDTSIICGAGNTQLFATGGLGNPQYSWSPGNLVSDSTIANPIATATQSTDFIVTLTEGNCTESDTVHIDVLPSPTSGISMTQAKGCAPLTVGLGEAAINELAYIWDLGDGSPVTNVSNLQHTYNTPGTYVVSLTAVGLGGCRDKAYSDTIQVSAIPTANFSSTPDIDSVLMLPDATFAFANASNFATSWLWYFGDGTSSTEQNPTHVYQEPGDYEVSLQVQSEAGCVASISKQSFKVIAPNLFVPNIFTPNGDGIHDEFDITYTGKSPFRLEVFDRWGTMMFFTENVQERWNGKGLLGEKSPAGVYFYVLKIGEKTYTGNVTLLN